jgi:hypothetical protein
MKILIACEFSGTVREAFNAYHDNYAISCDIVPPEDGRIDYHYEGDVREILYDGWDMMIAFPPCTRLCNSGVRWLHERNLWNDMKNGAKFFKELLDAPIPMIALENPIPHKYALEIIGRKYDQIIQPWQFGHGETKATCLWLKGLPNLIPTNVVSGREQRVHKLPPSENRWIERARTYTGIAQAMAEQWTPKTTILVLGNGKVVWDYEKEELTE